MKTRKELTKKKNYEKQETENQGPAWVRKEAK